MNEWVWSNGGMILTGENWSTGRKTLYSVGGRWMSMAQWWNDTDGITKVLWGKICPSSTFSTSNLTWHGQRLNQGACGQRSTMNFPSNNGMSESAWNIHVLCLHCVVLNFTHRFYVSIMFFICFLVSSSVLLSATVMLHRCDSTQSV